KHLAVKLDLGRLQAGDELVVREAVRAGARVDPHDPEAAELALLVLAVAVGVAERVLDLLLGVRVRALLDPPIALRLLEDLAALLARVNRSLDPWHQWLPWWCRWMPAVRAPSEAALRRVIARQAPPSIARGATIRPS